MKSAGKWPSNHSAFFERVMDLGERHRAGLEPAVEHVFDPAHHRASRRVVRVGPDQFVDGGAVQILPDAHQNQPRSAPGSRRRRCAGHRGSSLFQTGTGAPQKRLRVIDQSRAPSSHLPNAPSVTYAGTQLISWFSSSIRSLMAVTLTNQELTALYIERRVRPPAMGIGVLVGLVADEDAFLSQVGV